MNSSIRMRVCFFIPKLQGGGAERQCAALLNELQKHPDVEMHLMLLSSSDHDHRLDVSNLKVHKIEVKDFANPAGLVFAIRTLRSVRPDVLVSWLHPADIWAYAATRLVRATSWIMTERDSAYPDEFLHNLRIRLGQRGAAMVIANSEQGRRFWLSMPKHPPLRMVPNMVTVPTRSHEQVNDRSAAVGCIYVGRLETKKNIGLMTESFVRFANDLPDARLTITGQGSQAGLIEDIAQQAGMTDRIDLLGFRDDVPALLDDSRMFISLSKFEGMPNALMEAVAAGLPAVVSDIPSHRDLLGDQYPYYVGLDWSADDIAAVFAESWRNGPHNDFYGHARDVLLTMTPSKVAASYVSAFSEVTGMRRSNR